MSLTETINNSKSFSELQSIIMDASGKLKVESKISCWGRRYIQALGHDGTAGIDALASRVIELVREKKFEYTLPERAIGKLIADLITKLYETSDTQVKNSNCFIRLLCFLRSVPDIIAGQFEGTPIHLASRTCSKTRWDWMEADKVLYCNAFSYYTVEQFQTRFGRAPSRLRELNIDTNPFKYSVPASYKLPVLAHESR